MDLGWQATMMYGTDLPSGVFWKLRVWRKDSIYEIKIWLIDMCSTSNILLVILVYGLQMITDWKKNKFVLNIRIANTLNFLIDSVKKKKLKCWKEES